jgi:hypothetical protein
MSYVSQWVLFGDVKGIMMGVSILIKREVHSLSRQ